MALGFWVGDPVLRVKAAAVGLEHLRSGDLNELIETGKYPEVMPFPGRGHGVSDPPARKVLMNRVTQFFLDNL